MRQNSMVLWRRVGRCELDIKFVLHIGNTRSDCIEICFAEYILFTHFPVDSYFYCMYGSALVVINDRYYFTYSLCMWRARYTTVWSSPVPVYNTTLFSAVCQGIMHADGPRLESQASLDMPAVLELVGRRRRLMMWHRGHRQDLSCRRHCRQQALQRRR